MVCWSLNFHHRRSGVDCHWAEETGLSVTGAGDRASTTVVAMLEGLLQLFLVDFILPPVVDRDQGVQSQRSPLRGVAPPTLGASGRALLSVRALSRPCDKPWRALLAVRTGPPPFRGALHISGWVGSGRSVQHCDGSCALVGDIRLGAVRKERDTGR